MTLSKLEGVGEEGGEGKKFIGGVNERGLK